MSERAFRVPEIGETLAGKYRLKRLLGEGGMGRVLEAEHVRLRQPIAIKVLNPELLDVPETVERFEREARAAATLRSRHVVRVTDVEQTPEGVPYMVMELLEGADLESELVLRGRLPYPEVVDYVLQACGALVEAHEAGIVHRDLKPANLFLSTEEPDGRIVKVLDFGISKFLASDEVKLTTAGVVMGTALYMSPEQIRGESSIDERSDIWSLGVILYELIAGTAPWMGAATYVAAAIVSKALPDIRSHVAVPDALAAVIHAMLEKDPERRPRNIAEVAAALAPFAPPAGVGIAVAEQIGRRHQGGSERYAKARASAPSLAPRMETELLPGAPARPRRPERSTTAGTTTSALGLSGRPRALWGALGAAFGLGILGVLLIASTVLKRTVSPEAPGASGTELPADVAAPTPSTLTPPPPMIPLPLEVSEEARADADAASPAPVEEPAGARPKPERKQASPAAAPQRTTKSAPPTKPKPTAPERATPGPRKADVSANPTHL